MFQFSVYDAYVSLCEVLLVYWVCTSRAPGLRGPRGNVCVHVCFIVQWMYSGMFQGNVTCVISGVLRNFTCVIFWWFQWHVPRKLSLVFHFVPKRDKCFSRRPLPKT